MGSNIIPPVDLLNELLICDTVTGRLYWRPRVASRFKGEGAVAEGRMKAWNTKYAGREAFTATNKQGYKVGAINCDLYRAHRVIWAIAKGVWPEDMLDHINGDRSDNRLSNLREADNQQNQWNRKKSSGKSSKYKGVVWDKSRGLWSARIGQNGKTINLGRFSSEELAEKAYSRASSEMHGEFKRSR